MRHIFFKYNFIVVIENKSCLLAYSIIIFFFYSSQPTRHLQHKQTQTIHTCLIIKIYFYPLKILLAVDLFHNIPDDL